MDVDAEELEPVANGISFGKAPLSPGGVSDIQ